MVKAVERERTFARVRVHANRRGVDDDLSVAVQGAYIVVVDRSRAGDDHNFARTAALCRSADCVRRAAAAEDEHLFARKADVCLPAEKQKAVNVGIAAEQPAAAVDNGVDRADLHRRCVQRVAQRHDRLLVGNRDVHARKVAVGEKAFQRLRRQRVQRIRRVAEGGMDARRMRMLECAAEQIILLFAHGGQLSL